MQTERDLYVGIGALVAMLLVVSFGTVGLLMRMSPAIERILRENVASLEACDEMMAALALAGPGQAEASIAARFREALRRAQANITEAQERPALARIEAAAPGALRGEPADRAAAVEALAALHAVNSASMRRADERARQLGLGGAWAIVFLSCVALAVSVAVLRRLRQRLVAPLQELSSTLAAASRGDRHRRCRPMTTAPAELARILLAVNGLLDRAALAPIEETAGLPSPSDARDPTGSHALEPAGPAKEPAR
jgi:hypothetical protein